MVAEVSGPVPRLAAIVLLAVAGSGQVLAEQPRTMRLDYFHTGGQGLEVFAADRVVIEPLPWPGNLERSIDTLGTGTYRFEVRDTDGRVLYSRGFSTIFEEWVTTAEARQSHRTFHESVRFPTPTRPVQVVLQKRGDRPAFETVWQTSVDPGDMFIERSLPPRQNPIEIERHGDPPDKVDLLLLGDGYAAHACAAKFTADARRLIGSLFEQEPFRSRRDDFNVWGICPPSAESGITRPSTQTYRRTPVGATYDAFGSERYVLTFENRAMRDIAAWAPYEFLEIVVNNDTYGGGGIHGTFATVAADNDWADYLFVHEFGHHFAGLADEYYTSPVSYEPADRIVEPWQANVTALLDAGKLKWRSLVDPGTPVPSPWPKVEFEAAQRDFQTRRKQIRAERRPESEMSALFREEQAYATRLLGKAGLEGKVGAFQGANYDAQAFYRPQLDCVMFSRDEVPFCRVCQQALGDVIDLYARRDRGD